MSTKTALVLGVTGMVGRPLTAALVNDGWIVYGAARFEDKPPEASNLPDGCHPIRFDVTRDAPTALPEVSTVFLEVWDPSKPDLLWAINFYGVGRVVERYAGVADIINGSTINVYGDLPIAPTEDHPCRPTSEYGRSRYAQEKLIDYFSTRGEKRGIHIRYAHANSAETGVIRSMAEAILAEKSLGPHPDGRIQVIALEDFVRVTKDALERVACPPVAVNCCHPRVWTRRELAETIQHKLGRGRVVFDRQTGGLENSVYADTSRMVSWFGEPRESFETMLERAIKDL